MNVKACIEDIPVFVKENSIIPLNLQDDFKLFGHVGNKLDGYENLCFMAFVKDKGSYAFEDDMGNRVDINFVKKDGVLDVKIESNYQESFALIIRGVKAVDRVLLNRRLIPKANKDNFECGEYTFDGESLVIKIDGKIRKNSLKIKMD